MLVISHNSPLDLNYMEVDFTDEEVKNTLHSLAWNKAPSLKGFSISFYQRYWDNQSKPHGTLASIV